LLRHRDFTPSHILCVLVPDMPCVLSLFAALCLATQPHDIIFPLTRCSALMFLWLPHSHKHFQYGLVWVFLVDEYLLISNNSITVSFPKTLFFKSFMRSPNTSCLHSYELVRLSSFRTYCWRNL